MSAKELKLRNSSPVEESKVPTLASAFSNFFGGKTQPKASKNETNSVINLEFKTETKSIPKEDKSSRFDLTLPKQVHYEVRKNYYMETHCSKIDESFVDYLLDSDVGNFIVYFD